MSAENSCVLKLEHLIFDEISFKREGFQNQNETKVKFGFHFQDEDDGGFITSIRVIGKKQGEYSFVVRASGYFRAEGSNTNHDALMEQNASAIIFPYIRSQISLLTAQPETEPYVLPPMNIAALIEDAKQKKQD